MKERIPLNIGYAEGDGDYVPVGDRYVDAHIEVVAPGGDGQPRLEVTIDCTSGLPQVTRVLLQAKEGSPTVRTKDLRTLSVDDLVDAIVPLFSHPLIENEDGSITGTIRMPDSESEHYRAARGALRQAQRAGRRKVTPELLAKVADVYRANDARPAEAVEDAFGVSPRTAFRYIRMAREQGLLEPREG